MWYVHGLQPSSHTTQPGCERFQYHTVSYAAQHITSSHSEEGVVQSGGGGGHCQEQGGKSPQCAGWGGGVEGELRATTVKSKATRGRVESRARKRGGEVLGDIVTYH